MTSEINITTQKDIDNLKEYVVDQKKINLLIIALLKCYIIAN